MRLHLRPPRQDRQDGSGVFREGAELITVSVQLLFPANIAARLINLSQKVSAMTPSRLILGPKTPPHITLFSYSGAAVELAHHDVIVRFSDIGKWSDDENIWAVIGIEKTAELVRLRDTLILGCGNPALARKEFNPHVTVANIAAQDWERVTKIIENHALPAEAICGIRVYAPDGP